MTRQATDKILDMVEEGILDRDTVIMSCLKYMSEDDVADMAHSNEFFINEEEDEYLARYPGGGRKKVIPNIAEYLD